jgi:molybdenum-dependent DNA-binding transcriptional regulator ModE
MGGRLRMSERERHRIGPLRLVVCGELTLAVAAVQMGISYRQAVRVLRRYREEGEAGLVHRACGRASPRATDPAYKEVVLYLVRTK